MTNFIIKYHLSSGTIIERTVEASSLNDVKVIVLTQQSFGDEKTNYVNINQHAILAVEIEQKELSVNYSEDDEVVYSG